MTTTYDRRRARRERERERDLCGESMADYHARENPAPTKPGAGIPHVRCDRTPSLFGQGVREHDEPAEMPQRGTLI